MQTLLAIRRTSRWGMYFNVAIAHRPPTLKVKTLHSFIWRWSLWTVLVLAWDSAHAQQSMLTVKEALGLAFPGAELKKQDLFLTEDQIERIKKKSEVDAPRPLVLRYEAYKDGSLLGRAYVDQHRVRTLPETLLVVVSPHHKVTRVEVLSFREPKEYLPSKRWFRLFNGKPLTHDLNVDHQIRSIIGATLSARAVTRAVRRILAMDIVLSEDISQ